MGPTERVGNFGAGPAKLPVEVLKQLQHDIINWNATGMGILEVSHRSAEFQSLMEDGERRLRELVDIPEEYAVLFMPGGGTLQFAAVVCNLLRREHSAANTILTYLESGSWSQKAAQEAEKLLRDHPQCRVERISLVSSSEEGKSLLDPMQWKVSSKSAFIYYCENETIEGVEMPTSEFISDTLQQLSITAPLVADMSSNFLSRPINVRRFSLIFATAQKNFGPAGITIVIVKRDLLSSPGERLLPVATMLDYAIFDVNHSLYNTPPVFAIHVCDLVLSWLKQVFGDLSKVDSFSRRKCSLIYDEIEHSGGFYSCPVKDKIRSRMNVVFRICGGKKALEEEFIKGAEERRLYQLRGHRSVGGIRVSLYNAITLEDVGMVVSFMREFANKH